MFLGAALILTGLGITGYSVVQIVNIGSQFLQ